MLGTCQQDKDKDQGIKMMSTGRDSSTIRECGGTQEKRKQRMNQRRNKITDCLVYC